MEKEFGCKIHFPKKKEKVHGKMTEISLVTINFFQKFKLKQPLFSFSIEISSIQSAENVKKCLDALEIAVEKARKQAMPTHFVAVPIGLKSVKIREQYANLVQTIRADEELPV